MEGEGKGREGGGKGMDSREGKGKQGEKGGEGKGKDSKEGKGNRRREGMGMGSLNVQVW